MIYHKLLLGITIIAFFLFQANAEAADPLDPSQMGESMDMPLSQELINAVVPPTETDADNSLDNVNLTGAWTLDLKGDAPEQMKLYLIQNEDVVMGQGVINRGNKTENATASGSISGQKLSLTVMSVGVLDLYKLNLSLSTLKAAGTYAVYMADGSSRSGEVTFAVSSNIFKPASTVTKDATGAYKTADSAAATPVQLSGAKGLSRSISSTTSTSMSSGGGSMSEESSSSLFSGSVV